MGPDVQTTGAREAALATMEELVFEVVVWKAQVGTVDESVAARREAQSISRPRAPPI